MVHPNAMQTTSTAATAAFASPAALNSRPRHCASAPRRRTRSWYAPAPARGRVHVRACADPTPDPAIDSTPGSAGAGADSGADDAKAPASTPLMSTATSSSRVLSTALADAASRAIAGLRGATPHVALLFVSARLGTSQVGARGRNSLADVVPKLRGLLPELNAVIGCASDGVVGSSRDEPGVSITLLSLPGVTLRSFHVMPDDLPTDDATTSWAALLGISPGAASPPSLLVFADPTFAARGDLDRFLTNARACDRRIRIAGAVASTGAGLAGGHMLCTLPRDVLDPGATGLRDSGLVALALEGDIEMQPLVAPRVRVVGPVFTACERARSGNLPDLHVVGQPATRRSAVAHLKSVLSYATPEEKKRVTADLHIGVADPDEAGKDAAYVIRHVGSVDVDANVITTPATVRAGQSVRFYVKDTEAAKEALNAVLGRYKRAELAKSLLGYSNPPFAALMFADVQGGFAFVDDIVGTNTIANYICGVPIAGCISGAQIAPPRGCENGTPAASDADERSVVQNAASVVVLLRKRSGIEQFDAPKGMDGLGS